MDQSPNKSTLREKETAVKTDIELKTEVEKEQEPESVRIDLVF